MTHMRTIKLTPEMELEALQKVFASQPRVLYLNDGQRRHITRVTEHRLAALAARASRDGQRPNPAD
jgi:hypothetical protein